MRCDGIGINGFLSEGVILYNGLVGYVCNVIKGILREKI